MKSGILKRIILILLAAAAAAAVFFTVFRKSSVLEVGVFAGSYWDVANANSYAIVDRVVERFEKAHPGVRVHYYSGIRKDDYSEWLSRQLLVGKLPDVFLVLGDDYNQLVSTGSMKDLDSLMASDPDFDKTKYFSTAIGAGKVGGRQYALPYETVPMLMFVNKTLLKNEGLEVPQLDWNWNDLYDIASRVTRDTNHDGAIDQFGVYNYNWREAVYSNGATLFGSDGREAFFTDQKVIEAVKFAKQLKALNGGYQVTQDDFDGGHVAFMPLSYAVYRTYKTYPYRIKKYSQFQWDCITLPAGMHGANVSEVNTLLMGISSRTQHEQLAWEFLKLMSYDPETQKDLFVYSQGASVLQEVTGSAETKEILQQDMEVNEKFIDNQILSNVLETGITTPQFRKYNSALTQAENAVNRIIDEDDDVESSMRILERQINLYLRQ